jgi:gamma-glutamyltranspeptidase/glutathione hydrolase
MIANAIDFDMNIQEAIEAPRIAFVEPNTLRVEESIEASIREELEAMGHEVNVRNIGNAHGLSIEYGDDGAPARFEGGTDPRGTGTAKGY